MQRPQLSIRAAGAFLTATLCAAAVLGTPLRADTPARTATPAPAATSGNAGATDPLVAMFVWWNAAYKQKDGFTAEAFSRYFTADAVMRINGSDRSKGVADLAQHFRDIQARTEMVAIELPFIDEFKSADGTQIFTHHFVVAREKGKDSRERVMGYATIRNGRISLINFVSVPDPAQH
jgi:ketosteroid isomerase-like protein